MKADRRRWNERFKKKNYALGRAPNPFLKRHVRFLPIGRALDIAAGEGRNAVFLARYGCDVDAVDISEEGLKKARRLAGKTGVKIRTFLSDLDSYSIKRNEYDLIADFYFLKRGLIPRMKKGLKKGGKIIFETYTLDHRAIGTSGPRQARYFLKPNELLRLFKGFQILFYREGTFKEGGRRKAIASLIAQKV